MQGETRNLPLLLLGVGVRDGSPHDSMEEVVTVPDYVGLGEWSNEPHGLQGVVNLSGSRGCVIERLHELRVDFVHLGVEFMTTIGQLSLV